MAFRGLSAPSDRVSVLLDLLNELDSEERLHWQESANSFFHRDFGFLPPELFCQILDMLDAPTLLRCCQVPSIALHLVVVLGDNGVVFKVSRRWLQRISAYQLAWFKLAKSLGAKLPHCEIGPDDTNVSITHQASDVLYVVFLPYLKFNLVHEAVGCKESRSASFHQVGQSVQREENSRGESQLHGGRLLRQRPSRRKRVRRQRRGGRRHAVRPRLGRRDHAPDAEPRVRLPLRRQTLLRNGVCVRRVHLGKAGLLQAPRPRRQPASRPLLDKPTTHTSRIYLLRGRMHGR